MAKSKSPFTGYWHIVSMSAWEDESLNNEGQAFIEFDEEGVGKFEFGNVQGLTDRYCTKKRDGKRIAQFSWDGESADGTPLQGIGWVILEGGELSGTISTHLDGDLQFVAKRAKAPNTEKRIWRD
jgi:hypothetical protein